ncbi:MAG: hypothetical protein ACPLX8_02205, partial [Nanopusillaceae archaeon]
SIIDELIKHSGSHKLTKDELIIRCPYCGDSIHKNRQHLYIKLETDRFSFPFKCFRCDESGTIIKLLKDMNLMKPEYITKLINPGNSKKYEFNEMKKQEFKINNNNLDSNKLSYIKKRLKLDELPDYITRFVITDFNEVPDISGGMKYILNKNYVGFLTFNKKKIICRKITDNDDLTRYIVLKMDESIDYFLTIPNKVNLLAEGKILVGEGIFTVLAGYNKLKNDLKLDNCIVVSGAGKSYLKSTKYAMYSFGIPDWDIYILADSDVKKDFLSDQFQSLKNKNIKVLYTDKGDFCDDYTKYSISNLI